MPKNEQTKQNRNKKVQKNQITESMKMCSLIHRAPGRGKGGRNLTKSAPALFSFRGKNKQCWRIEESPSRLFAFVASNLSDDCPDFAAFFSRVASHTGSTRFDEYLEPHLPPLFPPNLKCVESRQFSHFEAMQINDSLGRKLSRRFFA